MTQRAPRAQGVVLPTSLIPRFAGPAAFSQVVIQPVLGLLSLNAFAAGIFGDATQAQAIAFVALATLTAWGFFTVCGVVINKFLTTPTRARVGVVAATYGATELVRISTLYALLANEAGVVDFGVGFRSVSAVLSGLVLLGLASVAVNDYRSYRDSYRRYSQQLARVRSAVHETGISVERVRDQLALKVRKLLTHDIHEAFSPTASQSPPADRIADELFRIANQIVRPLSHGVFDESLPRVAPTVLPSAPEKPPRVSVRTFFSDATSVAPFQPATHTLMVALVLAPVLMLLSTVGGVALSVACVGLVFALGYLGRRFLTPVLSQWPVIVRVLVQTAVYATPVVVFVGAVVVPGLPELRLTSGIFAYGAALGAVLGWLPALAEGLRHSRQRFISDLESLDNGLGWFRVRAQAQLWLDQKRLALALHGDVQATILASAMHLKKAVYESPEKLEQVVSQVKQTIRQSLLFEPPAPAAKKLRAVVATINRTWSTLVPLTVDATPAVVTALESDGLALEVVSEVMRELHMNAFKHGRATECVVTITQPTPDTVRVQACNNGLPLPEVTPPWGLGGRFLESVSLEKTSHNTKDGVCVELSIPLTAAPPQDQPAAGLEPSRPHRLPAARFGVG